MSVGRHRGDPEDEARTARSVRRILPTVERPLYTAVCTGLAVGTVARMVAWYDVSETQGRPTERAQVVTIHEHDPSIIDGCGRNGGDKKDITWESLTPPSGLPVRFVEKDRCRSASVGDVHTIVRVVHVDGNVDTYVDPARTRSEDFARALVGAGAVFGIVLLLLQARRWWLAQRH